MPEMKDGCVKPARGPIVTAAEREAVVNRSQGDDDRACQQQCQQRITALPEKGLPGAGEEKQGGERGGSGDEYGDTAAERGVTAVEFAMAVGPVDKPDPPGEGPDRHCEKNGADASGGDCGQSGEHATLLP